MYGYWDFPDLPEEKELMDKHGVEMKALDKYRFTIKLKSGLLIEIGAYPEDPGVSTNISICEEKL